MALRLSWSFSDSYRKLAIYVSCPSKMETGEVSAVIRDAIIPAILKIEDKIKAQFQSQLELKQTLERFSAESQVISGFLGPQFDLGSSKALAQQKRLFAVQKRLQKVLIKLNTI